MVGSSIKTPPTILCLFAARALVTLPTLIGHRAISVLRPGGAGNADRPIIPHDTRATGDYPMLFDGAIVFDGNFKPLFSMDQGT